MTTAISRLTCALTAVCMLGAARALLRELAGDAVACCGPSPANRWMGAALVVSVTGLLLLAGTEVASWLAR